MAFQMPPCLLYGHHEKKSTPTIHREALQVTVHLYHGLVVVSVEEHAVPAPVVAVALSEGPSALRAHPAHRHGLLAAAAVAVAAVREEPQF